MPHRVEGVQELAGGGAPQPQAAVLAAAGQQVAALAPGQRAGAARQRTVARLARVVCTAVGALTDDARPLGDVPAVVKRVQVREGGALPAGRI